MDIATLKERVSIVQVVAQYRKLYKQNHEFIAQCLFHAPDNHPSMSVIPDKKRVHCHACDAGGDIIDVVMFQEGISSKSEAIKYLASREYPEPQYLPSRRKPLGDRETGKPPPGNEPNFTLDFLGGEPTLVHVIRDLDGSVLGYEAIYYVGGKKEPRLWTWGRRGNLPFSWGLGTFNMLRPLFGLQNLTRKPRAPVIISEGPKKALAVEKLLPMYASLSILNGCESIGKHDWVVLAGRRIIIWPDADAPGLKMARELSMVLTDVDGLALDVRIINPEGQGRGWDAADALEERWTTEQTIAWAKQRIVSHI